MFPFVLACVVVTANQVLSLSLHHRSLLP